MPQDTLDLALCWDIVYPEISWTWHWAGTLDLKLCGTFFTRRYLAVTTKKIQDIISAVLLIL
jgi:hypothetical protein